MQTELENESKGDLSELRGGPKRIRAGTDFFGKRMDLEHFQLETDERVVWARRVWAAGTFETGFLILTTRSLAFVPQTGGTRGFEDEIDEIRSVMPATPKMTRKEIALAVGTGIYLPGAPIIYYGAKRILTKVVSIVTVDGKERRFTSNTKNLTEKQLVEEVHKNLRFLSEYRREEAKTRAAERLRAIAARSERDAVDHESETALEASTGDAEPGTGSENGRETGDVEYPDDVVRPLLRAIYRKGCLAARDGEPRDPPSTIAPYREAARDGESRDPLSTIAPFRELWTRGYDSVPPVTESPDASDADGTAELTYPDGLTNPSHRTVYRNGVLAARAGEPRVSTYESTYYHGLWERGYDSVATADLTEDSGEFAYPSGLHRAHWHQYRRGMLDARSGRPAKHCPYTDTPGISAWHLGYDAASESASRTVDTEALEITEGVERIEPSARTGTEPIEFPDDLPRGYHHQYRRGLLDARASKPVGACPYESAEAVAAWEYGYAVASASQ
jgi:ribosome modulation factor